MPCKRPSARSQPETREKRRPERSVVASINLDEFSHGLHKFCAERIRKKLVADTNAERLLTEAFEMVSRDIGPFPSEEHSTYEPFPDDGEVDATERDMREIAMRNYDSLSETETYMWGLGIAGIVHQWERDTRVVITALGENPPNAEKLERMDFEELCKQVATTGLHIKQHSSFAALRRACLIANTIKHGAGKSFRELVAERPDLFHGGPIGVRMGNLCPEPHHLRVSVPQFDEAVLAIDQIWHDYEDIVLVKEKPSPGNAAGPKVSSYES